MKGVARTRVALVLGAGGPVGHAFHAGVVAALHARAGWDARDASLVVGTSAGSQVALLLRAGMAPSDLHARVVGDAMTDEGRRVGEHFRRTSLPRWPRIGGAPASLRYLALVARGRTPWSLGRSVAALLPAGSVHREAEMGGWRERFGDGWPAAPTWLPAVDLDTGEVVLFGRADAPRADVGLAAASTSSVPGFCAPVSVAGRRFIDGGVACSHHLREVGDGFDEVFVSSPLSTYGWVSRDLRDAARRLERGGAKVTLFEPDRALAQTIGHRFLDPSRAKAVGLEAFRLACGALRRS